jgi:glycosyltransferase involved in cell wall biosynthesis
VEQLAGLRMLDLGGQSDALISIRTPSYLIRHPRKIVWFIHHHRGAYDLWGTPFADLADDADGRGLRDVIHRADAEALAEASRIVANSHVVAARLRRFNGIRARVVYPPLGDVGRFESGPYGDALFYPSRINPIKRQLLAIEAMRHVKSGVRLSIAGAPESATWRAHANALIRAHGLGDRVEIVDRYISEQEKVERMARALGVVYVPYDEDSYGYVSMEAFAARRPVVTTTDSGGVLEAVTDDVTGLVTTPTPAALAGAFDRLYEDRALAARLGAGGRERLEARLGWSWDDTVRELLV